MAARRLLIVMLVLLGISTLAAALVPPPERQREDTASSAPTTKPRTEDPPGERVAAEVSTATARPEEVRVAQGDQLALVVETGRPSEISVPDFGLIEFAEPDAPARFDILVDRDGRFEVTADRRGTVATIVADRAKRQS